MQRTQGAPALAWVMATPLLTWSMMTTHLARNTAGAIRVMAASARDAVDPSPSTMSSPSLSWSPSVNGCQASISTAGSALSLASIVSADAASGVSTSTSSTAADRPRSTTSTAVMSPPASPIALASAPRAPGRSGTLTRSRYTMTSLPSPSTTRLSLRWIVSPPQRGDDIAVSRPSVNGAVRRNVHDGR